MISGQSVPVALPRRWVVERTFAWLGLCRRLSKDCEVLPDGQFARGMYADGAQVGARSDCTSYPASGCVPIQWPGERTTARHELDPQGEIRNWFGSLVDDMRDASGQMYRRNRYYDPQTGQFTERPAAPGHRRVGRGRENHG